MNNEAEIVAFKPKAKVTIRVNKGEDDIIWRAVQRAAIAINCQIFVRGGELVEPLWRVEQDADGREFMAMSLVRYNQARLTDQLIHNAVTFEKYDARKKGGAGYAPCDPPDRVIEMLLERGDWDFKTIIGVINTPTMRPDGSLLLDEGYDAKTQLWYKSDGHLTLPAIPDQPTRDDALAALKTLSGLLEEFVFVDGQSDQSVDRSVALAVLLTVVLRGAFDVAPLFFITKPEAGTGGSYFVRLVSTLATGEPATPLIASSDPKELHKELSAKAREGRPILNLNNLTFDLESPLLCQIVTEGEVDIRPFGRNDRTIRCDCRSTTAIANGNNVHLVGDLVRRAITIRLNAKQERPELRKFKLNPVEMIRAERGKYLAAVFTIARAHVAAGSPVKQGAEVPAGFEKWSRKVLQPLLWLGLANPMDSMKEARELDPERSALRARHDAIATTIGPNVEFSAADILSKAKAFNGGGAIFPDIVAAFTTADGKINSLTIGNQLSADNDRILGNRFIQRMKRSTKGNTYKLVVEQEPARDEPPM
jgi:putative DNA primase/helicase